MALIKAPPAGPVDGIDPVDNGQSSRPLHLRA